MATVEVERVQEEREKFEPLYPELLAAANYIREHGWCQGEAKNAAGAVCMEQAILCGCDCSKPSSHSVSSLIAAVSDSAGVEFPYEWNDAPERTQDEVIELLERTAWFGAP